MRGKFGNKIFQRNLDNPIKKTKMLGKFGRLFGRKGYCLVVREALLYCFKYLLRVRSLGQHKWIIFGKKRLLPGCA